MGGKLKISEIFSFEKGPLQSSKNEPGEYDFITASSEWKTHSSYAYDCEALLVAVAASGSLGRTHYVKGKFIGSDLCFVLSPKDQEKLPVNLKLYYHIFNAVKDDLVYRTATGSAKKAINKTNFGNYEIPYFDIETQNKYAKLFDDFVVLKTSLEIEIESQEQNLTKLRQSALQDAVQGRLTKEWREQNPKVEPASELLKKIKVEKEQLIKEKKIKKEKPLPPIAKDEIPFEIPESWEWIKIGDYFDVVRGSSPRPKADPKYWTNKEDGYHWITIADFTPYDKKGFLIDTKSFLSDIGIKYSREVSQSDVLIACSGVGSVGRSIKLGIEGYIYDGIIAIRKISDDVIRDFLSLFIKHKESEIYSLTTGGGWLNINTDLIKNYIIGIPPLEEQKAIVKKVTQLLAHCDVLEQEIKASKTNGEKLMQSVLSELLGEENNTLVNKTTSKKEIKKPSREIKYNSKTLLMDLVKLLKENGKLHAKDLWKMSKYPEDIDAFYAELKKQIEEEKVIKEVENEKGYLELA